jgi:hypothetical protein
VLWLYFFLCRRYCKDGMTLSSLAWLRAQRGKPFWRNRIDGAWLLFGGVHNHCQSDYQKGRSSGE